MGSGLLLVPVKELDVMRIPIEKLYYKPNCKGTQLILNPKGLLSGQINLVLKNTE